MLFIREKVAQKILWNIDILYKKRELLKVWISILTYGKYNPFKVLDIRILQELN